MKKKTDSRIKFFLKQRGLELLPLKIKEKEYEQIFYFKDHNQKSQLICSYQIIIIWCVYAG